jgi:hypothetical protein
MTAALSVVSDRSRASFHTKSARRAAHGDEMPWPALIEGPFVIKNGHLYLSLMADGGIYEFEPAPPRQTSP